QSWPVHPADFLYRPARRHGPGVDGWRKAPHRRADYRSAVARRPRAAGRARWVGRNSVKDVVRADVWRGLIDSGVNIGPTFDHIPNFVGADIAAKRLSELDAWKKARVVKCNPDPPQIP